MKTIHTPGRGLGDNWYTINKLLRESQQPVWISCLSRPERARAVNVERRLREILPLLDAPVEHIRLTPAKPTNYKTGFHDLPWNVEYYPTRVRWTHSSSSTICYQFDGRFLKGVEGLPHPAFLKWTLELLAKQYDLVCLSGLPSLQEVVEHLSTCRCFLGVSSGISHIAHSVGTPLCLLEGGYPIEGYHTGKPCVFARTTKQILAFCEDPDEP